MQDTELITKAINGDTLAYGELMELLHRTVEKFAFQCGVGVDDIKGVTQDVFIDLYNSLSEFENTHFNTVIYKIALNTTRSYGRKEKRAEEKKHELEDETSLSTRSPQSRILVFDEDRELHDAIHSLEEKQRNPLVLFYFHELSYEQIGEILNISADKVESRMLSSREQLKSVLEVLDDNQLETNLNLLKKSYKRVPSKFNSDDVLQIIIAEGGGSEASPPANKPTYNRQKLSIWAVSLVFVFLIGILSASFLDQWNNNGSQKALVAEENDSEELKESYEREKANRREMLGLTEDEYNQIEFVQMADQLFSLYFYPDGRGDYSGEPNEELYNNVIESLTFPSEMVEEVTEKAPMDERESMLFVDELDTKVNQLVMYYNTLIDDHRELLNTAKMNGKLDARYLSTYRNELPQVLKSMMEHAPQQGIVIGVSQDETSYEARFNFPNQWGKLYESVENPALSLFYLKQMGPFTLGGELLKTPLESAMIVTEIERALLSTQHRTSLYTLMKSHYEDLAYTLLFKTPMTSVVTDGHVNEDYKLVWNNLRYSPGISPMKYFIRPMYESVSNNEWKLNETYHSLNFKDLQVAFTLAQSGDLQAIMPKENSGAKSMSISWPNSEIQQKVTGYIKDNEYQDLHYVVGMTPIESIVLFDYAQEMNLQSINHQLISFINFNHSEDSNRSDDFNKVLNSWLNNNLIAKEATSLRYQDEKSFEHNGNFVGAVDVMNGESVIRSIPIIRNGRGVWLIDAGTSATRYHEPQIDINEGTIQSVQDLYSRFKENYDHTILKNEGAIIIAGIYLESLTQGDLETQYELLNKGEDTNIPSRDEFFSTSTGEDFDWKTRFDSFESIQSDDVDENEEYNVIVWLNLNEELVTGNEYRKAFQMRKTLDGWRVHFMPFQ